MLRGFVLFATLLIKWEDAAGVCEVEAEEAPIDGEGGMSEAFTPSSLGLVILELSSLSSSESLFSFWEVAGAVGRKGLVLLLLPPPEAPLITLVI